MLKSYWDTSGKPPVFVVTEDGKEIYRGPFSEGYELFSNKKTKCPLCSEPRSEFDKATHYDVDGNPAVIESCRWCGSTFMSASLDSISPSPKKS